ncbi:DKNYY domain-containing protein [Parasphingorhabdus sp.]|uniref:DKNYY domain-containing protein n=1 Tax=Parasphingorhabdus sp. TaxID=2709688 RepID=UPI0032EFE9A8
MIGRTIAALAVVAALGACALYDGEHYEVRADEVIWISYPGSSAFPSFSKLERKTEADAASFQLLSFKPWGKDRISGYYQGHKLAGSDPKSFRAINEELAADDHRVWNGTTIIEDADGASFRLVSNRYGVDKAAAYVGWTRFVPCDLSTFAPLDSEMETFAADSQCVYANSFTIPLQDRKSFEMIGSGYSKDRLGVYWMHFPVTGADVASFRVAAGTQVGRDKSGCWLGTERRPCRD